ncbi:MAG: aminotransferase class I/II-fold pyridoxal phosphate-dependent enzyme [Planctomycetaceae bacterium]
MQDRADNLAAARERIRAAYSPELFGALADQWAGLLRRHLQTVEGGEGPVLNWEAPPENIAAAGNWLVRASFYPDPHAEPPEIDELGRRFGEVVRTMLARGHNLHHPRYVGHQVPASIPIAALFDAVGSATNQVMAIYEMGPWATAVERAVIERIGKTLGLTPGTFAGLITHGGSLANTTALLTARNVALGESWEQGLDVAAQSPALLVHPDVHYSITRTAGMLGLGTRSVVRVPLDDRRRMDPRQLDALIARLKSDGRRIVAVVSCACATPIGAFDPLVEISAVCRMHGVWLHVDAAHGGAAAFSDRHQHLIAGIEQADSIVVDAHKMLFMPALCALVFYRNAAHRFEAFRQDAPYLFDPSAPGMAEYDSGMLTVECTKRAAAYGLWGVWSLFGPQLFADLVDATFDLGQQFHAMLRAASDFEPLHEPQCNIVAFRYRPERLRDADVKTIGELNLRIRRRIVESGKFYLVQANLNGGGALRVTLINPLTTAEDLRELMEEIRRVGEDLSFVSGQ